MYAVIKTGGKQYKVAEGEVIQVESLPQEVGETVELQPLLVAADDEVMIGNPLVESAKVLATVKGHGRRRKVTVFKYRPKQRYQRKRGHRQHFTQLRIDQIVVGGTNGA